MKKVSIVFITLIILFFAVWAIKLRTPMNPIDPFDNIATDAPWWQTSPNETPEPDDEWVLDPEIPSNYIPVIGGNELYMVIDENGNIIKYRRRTKQEDGSWLWEDVDPNIPDNYEAVPGLENVYKVTNADGTVHYYKYVRNDDDTYYFLEVDKNGNSLKGDALSNDSIPANYVHISGNIYAVYNEYGVLIGYKKRVQNSNGSYSWVDCEAPTTNNEFSGGSVPGLNGNNSSSSGNNNGGADITVNRVQTTGGYREEEYYTTTKQEGDWMVVYETLIVKEYDSSGSLISTKKTGPTELNRFPATELNDDLIDALNKYQNSQK